MIRAMWSLLAYLKLWMEYFLICRSVFNLSLSIEIGSLKWLSTCSHFVGCISYHVMALHGMWCIRVALSPFFEKCSTNSFNIEQKTLRGIFRKLWFENKRAKRFCKIHTKFWSTEKVKPLRRIPFCLRATDDWWVPPNTSSLTVKGLYRCDGQS